jgi:hypothetical protein
MIITEEQEGKILFKWDNGVYLGYAYKEVDGYYVFVFGNNFGGFWSDYSLREIANKLTELNLEWDKHINNYFNQQQKQ